MNAPARRLPKPLRVIKARPRLFASALIGIVVGFLLPHDWRPITRSLVGWNAAIWLYLIAAAVMMLHSEHQDIHRRAASQDEGRYAVLALAAVASTVSFGAIFALLATIKDLPFAAKSQHIGLAIATILGSWFFVHMIFALHYAHEFFRAAAYDAEGKWRGGIEFPGEDQPGYSDFLYFSYVIGVSCATSDSSIPNRTLRRLALVHCVLAFFYNNAVLALAINIGAGFIGG
jgi:uncharacterized membrane protein